MRPTIVYVHGNGPKPPPDVLRLEWDQALFGRDMGASSRMAYWASLRYARPLDVRHEVSATKPPCLAKPPCAAAPPEQFINETLLESARETVVANTVRERDRRLERWLRSMTYSAEVQAGNENGFEFLPFPSPWRTAIFRKLVEYAFKDVHAYFFGGAKEAMREVVRAALRGINGPVVVVGHSLGSIIAYDVLRELAPGTLTVPLFVTVGSPLGVTEVQDLITTPLQVPAVVDRWLNVSDRRDLVALDPTIGDEFGPNGKSMDAFVSNSSENHHGISEYLRSRPVREAVVGLFGGGQEAAAADRVARRTNRRQAAIRELQRPGGLVRVDAPDRVAARIGRLGRQYANVPSVDARDLAANQPEAMATAEVVLEGIVNTPDLVSISYLEGGLAAARAVARVVVPVDQGVGYGTGSMVSPRLLLTNHHVLGDAATAAGSRVEFNYQDTFNGQAVRTRTFELAPEQFFLANEALDFALVAVRAPRQELEQFSYNKLIADEGKAIMGEFVTIIQHPCGQKKQIALRENRIVDVLNQFLHYETDTEPGSSGSPVFNDQWELVALHHAAVSAPEQDELGGCVNEGVRISSLVAFLRGQVYSAHQQAFVVELLGDGPVMASGPVHWESSSGGTCQWQPCSQVASRR